MSLPTSFTTQSLVNQRVIQADISVANQESAATLKNSAVAEKGGEGAAPSPLLPSSPPRIKTRTRSESSPTQMLSPSKLPVHIVPSLNLDSISQGSNPPLSEGTSATRAKQPIAAPDTASRVHIMDTVKGSASAPTTPRKTPRPTAEYQPSSVRRSIKSPGKERHPDIQPIPSPRKSDQTLILLADEIAGHCVSAMHNMRDSDVRALLRQDLKIPMDKLSPELRARLPESFTKSVISHSDLIYSIYSSAFRESKAGKTLLATRQSVMNDYSNEQLTVAEMETRVEADPAIKKRYKQNMDDRAHTFASFVFDVNTRLSPASMISPELLNLWKAMDKKLSALNPGREGRERLAYDLILTRMVLRIAKGDNADAKLAIPVLFYNSVKDACAGVFPAFASKLIQSFDNDRFAPTFASNFSASSITSRTDTSTSTSTSTTSMSSSSSKGASSTDTKTDSGSNQ